MSYENWKDQEPNFQVVDVRHLQGNFFPGLKQKAMGLEVGEGFTVIQTFEPHPLYAAMEALGFEHHTEQAGPAEFHVSFCRVEKKDGGEDTPFKPLSLANAVGAGRMRQATRELIKAYACGVESAALDDVFELLAWNQGIGYFSSEIGPSTLFQAYKLIKQQEKQGAERPRICQMLREKFGEKNAEVTVL